MTKETQRKIVNALMVFVLDPKIHSFLETNYPKSLELAKKALGRIPIRELDEDSAYLLAKVCETGRNPLYNEEINHAQAREDVRNIEIAIHQAQAREDSRADAEGRKPRLIATMGDIKDFKRNG